MHDMQSGHHLLLVYYNAKHISAFVYYIVNATFVDFSSVSTCPSLMGAHDDEHDHNDENLIQFFHGLYTTLTGT